ncbi:MULTISPECIES: AIM24 family protein [unclassified Pseudomonas]|uniref:AIM24 family protein n=2 Tax=Pseudomonas TaxID=286 RepID=UPI000A5E5CC9|nr:MULTISPECIES: AIM24 family protein [unclassified Pseudomonas]QOF85661.1 AIM24 family protein [Pseudomonas sp. ADPe]
MLFPEPLDSTGSDRLDAAPGLCSDPHKRCPHPLELLVPEHLQRCGQGGALQSHNRSLTEPPEDPCLAGENWYSDSGRFSDRLEGNPLLTWTLSVRGTLIGPMDTEKAKLVARESPGSWCWRPGMSDWQLAHLVPEIRPMKKDGVTPLPEPSPDMISPKPGVVPGGQSLEVPPRSSSLAQTTSDGMQNASEGFGSSQRSEGIDFKVFGSETQFVELELDQGESAIAEAGAMMFKSAGVEMHTIFGDGSNGTAGLMGKLFSAGKRLLTGESLFTTVFTQQTAGKGRVAFAAPFPGTILVLDLKQYGDRLICQKDSFLAGSKGVTLGLHFQKKILTGLFGGEGFILQKLEGDGLVFVHMGGTIRKIDLAPGERLDVDTGCLAAMTNEVDFDIRTAGGIKSMLFGGEGMFFGTLTGPGTVWLQSLPFSRLAGRMLAAAPAGGGQRQGEGSILGGLGEIIGGR